jgi:hypothetical protein
MLMSRHLNRQVSRHVENRRLCCGAGRLALDRQLVDELCNHLELALWKMVGQWKCTRCANSWAGSYMAGKE